MNPPSVSAFYDPFCTEYHAVRCRILIERIANIADVFLGKLFCCFLAEARKYFVCMVMVMMVTAASAIALIIVVTVMMVVMLMVMMLVFIVVVIIVIVVMVVTAAASIVVMFIIVIMVVMVVFFLLIIVIIVMMVMVMIMIVVITMRFSRQLVQLCLQRIFPFHCLEKIRAGKSIPIRGDNNRPRILFTQECDALGYFGIARTTGMTEYDAPGVFDLIVIKLAEILDIHLTFIHICNRRESVQDCTVGGGALDCPNHIGKFADPGRFNDDPVGLHFGNYLAERRAEIPDERATNATRIQFIDLHTGVLEKSTVNTDLTELIFDQNDLFTLVGFAYQLFDKRRLPCSEKPGNNINFGHGYRLLIFHHYIITSFVKKSSFYSR